MKLNRPMTKRIILLLAITVTLAALSSRMRADTGTCGGQMIMLPFTDVASSIFFCSIAQAFFTGLTNGTSPTTYSPSDFATREQMAAFITRTQDSALKRSGIRATAGQWWTPQSAGILKATAVGTIPRFICFDGEDIWVANSSGDSVTRVHASDGRVLSTWTGAIGAFNTIAAAGFIFVTGADNPGVLYRIDPAQPPGATTVVANDLGPSPISIAFDGLNLWTANEGVVVGAGSISRYNVITDLTTTFTLGFNQPAGIVFDGAHLWVLDRGTNHLHRVNPANGTILESVSVGTTSTSAAIPVFDGSNIWVPVQNAVAVVSTSVPPVLLATLTGNGLGLSNGAAAFDGERIMVTSVGSDTVSLWKASSLTPLGFLSTGDSTSNPRGVCSDGLHFWITLQGLNQLVRF